MTTGDGRGSPAERVAAAVARWGTAEVVRRCGAMLGAGPDVPVVGDGLELGGVLGGLRDAQWLNGGKPPGHEYWARVWAARALRYVWDDSAGAPIVAALDDEQWRIREMAAKVIGDREIGEAADALLTLAIDPHQETRVRTAAVRALGEVGEGEHGESVRELLGSPDSAVTSAARQALSRLTNRLDRQF